ncbi:TlpA family protein disulfide reductase [Comamonas jiangduensis]|uniref:TlpA family protein disulfide reductase n=1 Tax=Comamonas jiangduensis TaxID=1194168 RepID=UPI003BF8CE57
MGLLDQFGAPPSAIPAWETLNFQGETVDLAALQGKPVVVNLWASWCPLCVREMSVLVSAHQRHPEVQFIWLNQQEPAASIVRFVNLHGLPAAQTWLDPQGFMAHSTLGAMGCPQRCFTTPQGNCRPCATASCLQPVCGITLSRSQTESTRVL